MQENVVFFSDNLDFVNVCSSNLADDVCVIHLKDLRLLWDYLKEEPGATILVDYDFLIKTKSGYPLAVPFGLKLIPHIIYLTSQIFACHDGRKILKLPFGLNQLSRMMPELFLTGRQESGDEKILSRLAGSSKVMARLKRQIIQAAKSECSILITGENGTGKSVIASIIHSLSARGKKGKVMVSENVAAISASLAESELFGSSRGAFTGAETDRIGVFGEADGSTLFMDEIGELDFSLQSKLLHVLQEGIIRPVGKGRGHYVDVRMIFATNASLEAMIKEKRFRQDLYYRIRQLEIKVPPLRERKEDIEEIARSFFTRNKINKRLSSGALEKLSGWDWPGNVRELENVIRKASLFSRENLIGPQMIDFYQQDRPF